MTPDERSEFIADIAAAIRTRSTDVQLSDDEQRWVKMAIAKEAKSAIFRSAVIEKTFSGLIWSAVVGLGYIILGWATQHGYKP
jgi:hypothetical protein